ncbi:serine-rich coiled-coil domain-containing protein 2-like [Gymnodraco acuticeps]|uniref:Serine-rich coiled-coil domain-containing protein 2-like n=1 Tax=Gymnodraco acuticeps TaxID=8218 RepID=A0A6P8T807_GYMAC|nr:serine-rich coiled-coil domain-containing protein 2-like [Gymnodraco acuticeps]
MSAPPLLAMPTMVSRLPKFGSKPKSSTLSTASSTNTRLTNGFYHHPGPAGVNGSSSYTAPTPVKQNGFIRVPTKWRKENEEEGGATGIQSAINNNHQLNLQGKTAISSTGKGRGFGFPSSSSPSPQSSPRLLPVSKSVSKTALNGIKPAVYGVSGSTVLNGTKSTLMGVSGSGSRPRIGSLRQPGFSRPGSGTGPGSGPGSRSGSPLLKKPPASRSHSSDSLGKATIPLTENDRFRSRSLTQVRQQPSPTLNPSPSPSSPLSHSSTNMATAQIPPKGVLVKLKSQSKSGLLPLKKPLLLPPSTGPASKPSGISYRLSRPSLIKQSRPLRVTTANGSGQEVNRGPTARRNSVETPSTTENSPESPPEAPERGLSAEMVAQREVSILGETLEDMSLSSNSSLDRNDTSQEYMDDFDNLGMGILLLSSKNDEDDSGLDQSCARFNEEDKMAVSGVSKAGLCFLDDGVDWCAENRLIRLPHRRRSNQQEDHEQGGSSLDLSPSDSCGSGGTYLWDEEGLEPLGGGNVSIHSNSNNLHIGSFDSDLNSIDVLENLESCDLDDDDLMLDEDLPEDDSLRSDGEGLAHMAQWRMRQLCWGNDNESDLESYKLTEDPGNKRTDGDLILDFSSSSPPVDLGPDVEDLAEDCSAVRSQLEFLQKLLLQEEDTDEDTLTTETLSPESQSSSDSQVQALLQEVQLLREDLRSRDRTITQLTLQLQTVPIVTDECCCREKTERHTQTSSAERESVTTQTPWREHPPQISRAPPLRREESCDRKQQIRPPQPSKLHLFIASKTSASSGSKVTPAPPALSRLSKPKSH